MICVSIGRGRHKHMIAEHAHLVEQGAKMVELRLDFIRGDVNLKRLLKDRPCPVIVTCRREADGGRWSGDEDERLMLLRSAIAEGVEYVDLEEDIAGKVPRYGKTKRVVSIHNFQETPDDLAEIHARLAKLDPDIIKLATMAHNPHDNLRMLRVVRDSEIPTVGMCMGEIGTPSRVLMGKYGAPFSYATFHHERALAPGQLSFKQMREIYRYEEIDADTEIFGVIADPVGHSLSPVIHNAAFRELNMNRAYLPFRVPREHLSEFLVDCREMGIVGLSVTIPHKEAVLKNMTHNDAVVRGIGAANTLVFEDGEKLAGYNTDHHAAMDSMEQAAQQQGFDEPFAGRTALLLGAGGVAKAIAYGLTRRGADVVIAGRTIERSHELAQKLNCRAVEWNKRQAIQAEIVINCTPVGMHPNVDETPLEAKYLPENAIVFDTVYNPEQTLFIKDARKNGCVTITGVDMFIRQAAMQFQLFTGEKAPEDVMRQEVKRTIGAVRF